jgi:hypothetical protein
MLWAGTAFRPPSQQDDEGWLIAERILSAGHRFLTTGSRRRFPQKLGEVNQWLELQRTGYGWLAEKKLSLARTAAGLRIRSGRRTLADGEPILILRNGVWIEGKLKLYGDGHKALASAFVTLSSTQRNVPLTARTRARIQRYRQACE